METFDIKENSARSLLARDSMLSKNKFVIFKTMHGFSLVELLTVVAVISILAMIALPSYNSYVENARIARAKQDIRSIENDIAAYMVDNPDPPVSLAAINRGGALDPWGRAYVYLKIPIGGSPVQRIAMGQPLNSDYDLYSVGPDGASSPQLSLVLVPESLDDILRASDGGFVDTGKMYFE